MGKVGRALDEGCNHFRIFYLMMDWIILSKCPALRIAGPFVLCDVILPCGIVHFLRLLCQELAQNCCHFLHSLFLCRICAIFLFWFMPVFFDCPASFVQLVKFNPTYLCSSSCGFYAVPTFGLFCFSLFCPVFGLSCTGQPQTYRLRLPPSHKTAPCVSLTKRRGLVFFC